jgi:hypothetical protein
MSADPVSEPVDPNAMEPDAGSVVDWPTVRLDAILAELAELVTDDRQTAAANRIDRIALCEKVRAAVAAAQAAECVRFAQSQVAEQLAGGVHPRAIGRGIADQIGLACRISPFTASRRLTTARALWFDLPATYAKLTAGDVSEQVAEIVVAETRHLPTATRAIVDAQIVAAGIGGLGVRAAAACARRFAYQADPEAYLARGRTERERRRVGLRAAPDTMAVLTGYLPAEQGVACLAALRRHTDTTVAAGMAGPGTRSWPTPSSNASPAKPAPSTSTWRSRSPSPSRR